MSDYKLLIMSNPVPGREDEFEDWYDIHSREMVRTAKHVVGVQRFRRVETQAGDRPPYRHLVIAEWQADNLDTSWEQHIAAFRVGVAAGTLSAVPSAFDTSSNPHWFYEAISPHLANR